MEKQKKIKAKRIPNGQYQVDTAELIVALKRLKPIPPELSWIEKNTFKYSFLNTEQMKKLNQLWKGRKIKAIYLKDNLILGKKEKLYKISGDELIKLQNIIRDGFINHYNWILEETKGVVLSETSIQQMNEQWKSQKN